MAETQVDTETAISQDEQKSESNVESDAPSEATPVQRTTQSKAAETDENQEPTDFKSLLAELAALPTEAPVWCIPVVDPSLWTPDKSSENCTVCDAKFTILKRRHHCRACGRLVCGNCTKDTVLTIQKLESRKEKWSTKACTNCRELQTSLDQLSDQCSTVQRILGECLEQRRRKEGDDNPFGAVVTAADRKDIDVGLAKDTIAEGALQSRLQQSCSLLQDLWGGMQVKIMSNTLDGFAHTVADASRRITPLLDAGKELGR